MQNNQKFHVWFWLNQNRQKQGLSRLFMRIVVDGARVEISTTHLISKDHWNDKLGRMKNSVNDSIFINGFIDHARNEVKKHFLVFASEGKRTSSIELKNLYLGIDNTPKQKTIMEAYDYHNIKMSELVKVGKVVPATVKRHEITQNKIRSFMQHHYRVDDKVLLEMRLSFITEFEHYLLTVDKIQNNTAHKYIKNLKKVMTMAVGLDWIPANPFNNFKCSYHNPEREILTHDELEIIRNKKYDNDRMIEVRDVFIFCCYTGFAYADVYQFERNAVMKGLDGNYWLSTKRQKTGTKESVPLLPVPMKIIEKYQNHEYCLKNNKLLPIKSNQRYNSYLKELADTCSIKKNLTSHIARHTFATTITLANGVPIETVSAMLGHRDTRTTQIYAKVVEKKVSEDMSILRDKLSVRNIKKQA